MKDALQTSVLLQALYLSCLTLLGTVSNFPLFGSTFLYFCDDGDGICQAKSNVLPKNV